jgi:ABC-type phosphate transport system ATPase subunit
VPAESGWWADRVADHFRAQGELAELLEAVGIPRDALNWDVARLSTGERHRLAIVRCLALKPAVLLLDEPTASLDGEATERIESLLKQQLDRSTAVLIVTHDPEQASRIASRVAIMEAGKLSVPEVVAL